MPPKVNKKNKKERTKKKKEESDVEASSQAVIPPACGTVTDVSDEREAIPQDDEEEVNVITTATRKRKLASAKAARVKKAKPKGAEPKGKVKKVVELEDQEEGLIDESNMDSEEALKQGALSAAEVRKREREAKALSAEVAAQLKLDVVEERKTRARESREALRQELEWLNAQSEDKDGDSSDGITSKEEADTSSADAQIEALLRTDTERSDVETDDDIEDNFLEKCATEKFDKVEKEHLAALATNGTLL